MYPSHVQHTNQTFGVRCRVDITSIRPLWARARFDVMLSGAPGDEFIQRVWILPEEVRLICVLGTLFICGWNNPSDENVSL